MIASNRLPCQVSSFALDGHSSMLTRVLTGLIGLVSLLMAMVAPVLSETSGACGTIVVSHIVQGANDSDEYGDGSWRSHQNYSRQNYFGTHKDSDIPAPDAVVHGDHLVDGPDQPDGVYAVLNGRRIVMTVYAELSPSFGRMALQIFRGSDSGPRAPPLS